MNDDHISRLIQTLETEIQKAEALNRRDVELLQDLRRDIEAVLARSPAESGDVVDRLRVAAGGFEVTHPNLTAVLMQVMDRLIKLGV